ncbi:hypothetical protein F4779DRAFT_610975 [Xylariaceae sp. FL0662B]|nr:hypothetical protein F4779DRAFT_610975 [Xylariaceae sp. FL0662B]
MKSTLILLATAASLATAADFEGQPPCATPCLSSAIVEAGCDINDSGCQCGPTQSAIAQYAAPCLIGACDMNELQQAQSAGAAACSKYSATAGQTTSSASPTSTTSPTSSVPTSSTESVPSDTSVPTSGTSLTTSTTSGAIPTSSCESTTSSETTVAPSSSTGPSNATVATPTPTIVTTNGASAVVAGSFLALFMAVVAVM